MKSVQVGIASIIAVLAMSFTIAEHNGAFSDKSIKAITDCFKAGGTIPLQIKHLCTGPTITISPTDVCSVTSHGDKFGVWTQPTLLLLETYQLNARRKHFLLFSSYGRC